MELMAQTTANSLETGKELQGNDGPVGQGDDRTCACEGLVLPQ